MKPNRALSLLVFRLALCCSVGLLTQSMLSQTWQTVDDFQYNPPNPTVNFGLAVVPLGTVFASGIGGIGGRSLLFRALLDLRPACGRH